MHKRVVFRGEIYWLHETDYCQQLAPLDHYDDEAHLLANPFVDICFAIIVDGKIIRYGEQIGTVSELKDVIEIER